MRRYLPVLVAAVLAACGGGGGGGSSSNNNGGGTIPAPPPDAGFTDSVAYSPAATASLASAAEITAVTKHQVVVDGATLNYTATAGHLTALDLSAAPEASFFYIAYTLDGADPGTRPVTFFYNGGPGSATIWLHLGSFGPKRLATNAPSTTTPVPFAFVDNAQTLLDRSDLVFVDAVGTGFSEAIAPNNNRTFWSVDADAAVFRDFVNRYAAANGRTASPKFLFGESYGTTRSAVLASFLESGGTSLKGVVLQSSILNYNTNCGIFLPAVISCYGMLPSYAAIGAWLSLVQPPQPVAQLPAYMAQMRTFASGTYDPAARAWLQTHAPPDATLTGQLAADTGLAASQWTLHLNMDPTFFHDNVVPGSVTGFYDGRMVAPAGTFLASEGDPSSTFYDASFATTIVSYLANDLHYTNPSTYTVLSNANNLWNYSHAGMQLPDTVPDLAAAMVHNPRLRVFSANGYHDMVTPFFTTENDLARLGGNPNITVRFYQGGHMTYLDDVARVQEKADLAAFYQAAAAKSEAPAVPSVPRVVLETPPSRAAMPPAVFETKLRDPFLPEALRSITPVPPTSGAAFAKQVEERVRAPFDKAAGSAGTITREGARAAGLGYVTEHFDAIDARRAGAVSFEDVKRYLREQGGQLPE